MGCSGRRIKSEAPRTQTLERNTERPLVIRSMKAEGLRPRMYKGLTLIELLVSISVAALIVGVTVAMLKTSVDAYGFAQNEALLQQILRETIDEITDGTENIYGIKDSLEIITAKENEIVFVPPYIDGPYDANADGEYQLAMPVAAGASAPSGEVMNESGDNYYPASLKFTYGDRRAGSGIDKVAFVDPLPLGAKVRFVYHPETSKNKEALMEIKWDKSTGKLTRTYRGKTETIPLRNNPYLSIDDLTLEYYDNTNKVILPLQADEQLPAADLYSITAVKVLISAQIRAKGGKVTMQKSLPTFVNLRNTRNSGVGIILRNGTQFDISDSHKVRTFSVGNFMGIRENDVLELEARPDSGSTWKVRLTFGINDQGLETIKKYEVEYPAPTIVFSQSINRTTDMGFNLMTLGNNGLYDYDYDKNTSNFVDIKGRVHLIVTRMDIDGAALFVRP